MEVTQRHCLARKRRSRAPAHPAPCLISDRIHAPRWTQTVDGQPNLSALTLLPLLIIVQRTPPALLRIPHAAPDETWMSRRESDYRGAENLRRRFMETVKTDL